METEPSRINVTMSSLVGKRGGRYFCFRLGVIPFVKMVEIYIRIHTGQAMCPWFSISVREKSVREENRTQLASFWTRMGLHSEAAFFLQCVLNCGGSGMAPWWCGEVELLEMSGVLCFSCRTKVLAGQDGLLTAPRECLSWPAMNKRGSIPAIGGGTHVSST